jgi:hypothetical protein
LWLQAVFRTLSFALERAGKSIAARTAMIAMTVKSSTNVKARGGPSRERFDAWFLMAYSVHGVG